jgi:putative transcriptional regulator
MSVSKMNKRELAGYLRDAQQLKDFEDGKIKTLKGWLTVRVLLPPKPAQIKGLRKRLKLTQEGLARLLNSGVYAVRSWEQGQRVPDGPAILLFQMIAKDPHVLKAARETMGLTAARA